MRGARPGWIGVDLDGTLAMDEGRRGLRRVGRPVPAMLRMVKQWIADGVEVRIFTARVGGGRPAAEREAAVAAIEGWCVRHVGRRLAVTAEKDAGMDELWDDRARRIERNTRRRIK